MDEKNVLVLLHLHCIALHSIFHVLAINLKMSAIIFRCCKMLHVSNRCKVMNMRVRDNFGYYSHFLLSACVFKCKLQCSYICFSIHTLHSDADALVDMFGWLVAWLVGLFSRFL